MKKFTKIVSAAALTCALCVPTLAFAADNVEGASNTSSLLITTEAVEINTNVPSEMPFVFKADGTNVTPSAFTITNNNTLSAIDLKDITYTGKDGWGLANESDELKADTKNIALKAGLSNNLVAVDKANGKAVFNGSSAVKINPSDSQTIAFDVKRAAFSTSMDAVNAFDVNLNFGWSE